MNRDSPKQRTKRLNFIHNPSNETAKEFTNLAFHKVSWMYPYQNLLTIDRMITENVGYWAEVSGGTSIQCLSYHFNGIGKGPYRFHFYQASLTWTL